MDSEKDIESAIARIFEPGNHNDEENTNIPIQFYVDGSKCWVEFRAGHSGDAASLTALITQQEKSAKMATGSSNNNQDTSSKDQEELEALEMRIAKNIGDEHSNPAVHVIVAEICTDVEQIEAEVEPESNKEPLIQKEICGAVFATIDWNPHQSMRYLSVEEIAIDESQIPVKGLLLRRLLLSLSAIALQASCGGILITSSARTVLDSRVVCSTNASAEETVNRDNEN